MSRKKTGILGLVALVLLCAPTVGDIGSCGQDTAELDPLRFFQEKQYIDCTQCQDCGFETEACNVSCTQPIKEAAFDPDCFPLVHDGEVCLNALRSAGCDEYAAYIDDLAPTVPTECNFCPLEEKP